MQSLKFTVVIVILGSLFFNNCSPRKSNDLIAEKSQDLDRLDKRTRMDLAIEQEVARTKDPNLGIVPRSRLKQAFDFAESKRLANQNARLMSAITGVSWKERGPTNVGGRTRAIMVDPNDGTGKTVFSAGVAGGLWKTTDITAEQPIWNSVNDFFDNMAITTVAYDPSSTTTMYFGTGEGFFNIDAIRGEGIWKSTDGGVNWTQLSTTTGNHFQYVTKLVVTSTGTILATTRSSVAGNGGVMRSDDGGTTWIRELGSGTTRAADIEVAADGDLYASIGIFYADGIYKSTDDGENWTSVYTSASDEFRIELATAPSNSEYVYALVHDNDNSGLKKIMLSTNGGTSWPSVGTPSWFDQNCSTPSSDFTRGQAWYDLIAAVDPNDEDVVWIGGVDIFRTTNGGTNWAQMTNWAGNCDYPEVHADQHAMVYAAGNSDILYFGNDGGIYRTEDATATLPTFKRKEFSYVTSQYYSVAMHPTAYSPNFVGGLQDNGSTKITNLGVASMVEVTGGDGGFSHIDASDPNYQFTSFTGLTFSRSSDGGNTFSFVASNANGSFINPSDYDPIGQDMYAGYSAGRFARWLNARTAGNTITNSFVSAFGGGNVTHVSCSPNTSARVFFGLDNGRVVRVDNAASSPSGTNISTGLPTGVSVSCIAVEDGDDDHLLVTYSNYGTTSVYESTNGGTSWTAVEGNLPDMPVRWALFNPSNSDQALIATELGVWSTDNLNAGSTDWEPSNSGLANVRTDMLQIRSSDNLVVAATHGRGLFISDVFTTVHADFTSDRNTIYAEASINFTDASYKATSWEWDFGDGGTSTDENPSHTYKRFGKYEVTLTINSGADSETKADFIHVLPNVGVPFTTSDGGDFESNPDYFGSDDVTGGINLWELGAPGNVLTTVSSGTDVWKTNLSTDIVEADYSCALYSPNFNFTEAGTYTLSFQKSMEINYSNAPMGVQVQYSTDNGSNWTRLGSDDGAGTAWYERGPSSATSLETGVIHDRIGFNSNFTNQTTSRDVSFLSGNATVAFRIILFVDAGYPAVGYTRDGFMVDDFTISGPTNAANVNIAENDPGTFLSMNGSSDYVTLSNLPVNESFTAEMWINPDVAADGQTFLAKHDASGNDIFKIGYNGGAVEVDIRGTTTSGGTQTTEMQHLAVTVDKLTGTTSEVTVYRDGEELFQNTISEVVGDPDGLAWVIGQDWDGVATPSDYFDGSFEELRLWNLVRTQSEIRENNFLIVDGLDTDLIGYWQFNENTGTATENTITSNLGTLVGASWQSSTVPVGMGNSYSATINADGATAFGNLSLDFIGVSGSFDVVVFEIENTPVGTLPSDEYSVIESVFDPYFVVNIYGAGTFTAANAVLTYGPSVFTETNATLVYLYKRNSTSSGSWTSSIQANLVNPVTGVASFLGITSFSQMTIGAQSAPLPVEWTYFRAIDSGQGVSLEWQTATEQNAEKFIVEHSMDGKSFLEIGIVKAAGESVDLLDYDFDHSNPEKGVNYYRLKQVDFDGVFEYSDVKTVTIRPTSFSLTEVYPNPAKDFIKINFSSEVESTKIELLSIEGKSVFSFESRLSGSGLTEELNVSNLKRGIYFVKVSDGFESVVRKVVLR